MVKSALIGQPPLTQDDYWIIKGNLLTSGFLKADPTKGLQIPPFRPPPSEYVFETRGQAIMAVPAVGLIVIFIVTVARLLVRKLKKDLEFGLDDWLIVLALVCSFALSICVGSCLNGFVDPRNAVVYSPNLLGQGSGSWETSVRCHVSGALYG